jgi:hypothetical protein
MTTYVQVGSLRLSAADAEEYNALCAENERAKQTALNCMDARAAKRCRQNQNYLYNRFKLKHVPEEQPYVAPEPTLEQRMISLEMEIKALNKTLKSLMQSGQPFIVD